MKLYNKEVKERFLETLNREDTRLTYYYTLLRAAITEEIEGKDLYNFDLFEIADAIKNKQPFRVGIVKTQASIYRTYINWAIKHGYRKNNLNPLDGVEDSWYESLVDKERKLMFTEEEIDELIEKTRNDQDKATIQLIFEGVWGKALSELVNLKMGDVDFEAKEITLRDDGKDEPRKIKISDKALELIKKANNQRVYEFNNGKKISKREDFFEKPFIESDYVIKNVKSRRTDTSPKTNAHTIYTRLEQIKEDLNLDLLSPTIIRKSGQLKLAKDLGLKHGKIDKHVIHEIGEQYGMKKIRSNGFEYHNRTAMKDVTSPDNLMKYYGVDIED